MKKYFKNKLMKLAIWLFNNTKDYNTNFEPIETLNLHVAFEIAESEKEDPIEMQDKAIYKLAETLFKRGYLKRQEAYNIDRDSKMFRYSIVVKKAA